MGAGNLVTKYMEKSRQITFVLLFTSKICSQASQLHKLTRKSALPADRALEAICTYTILRVGQIPPVVPRQLADDVVRLLLPSKGQVRQGALVTRTDKHHTHLEE